MMPLRRYWLSVWRSTGHGRLSASSAAIAAISSMRLLVVCASPPFSSFSWSPKARIAPQPPGPGLPEQAPSVWMTTCGSRHARLDAVVAHARDRLVEAQLAEIFERILRPHQRARRHVEPVDQPRQQEAQAAPRREQRQRVALRRPTAAAPRIGLQQAPALGDVVGMVGLEAPGVEADRRRRRRACRCRRNRSRSGRTACRRGRTRCRETDRHGSRPAAGRAARRVSRCASSAAMSSREVALHLVRRASRHARRAAASRRPTARWRALARNRRRRDAAAPAPRRARAQWPADRPADPHAVEKGDDRRRPAGELAERLAARFFTGCGQVMPRACRCSIRPRKNGRSLAATRFS